MERLRGLIAILGAALAALSLALPAFAQARIALIVANADYQGALPDLDNPLNDAEAVKAALESVGFSVDIAPNVDERGFGEALARYRTRLNAAGEDAIGLFYFTGHGAQWQGINYLIPAGAVLRDKADLPRETLRLRDVFDALRIAGNATNFVIVDACRNAALRDPLDPTKTAELGLARADTPTGVKLVFSAQPGSTATDGPRGGLSPFAAAFAELIATPGAPEEEVFRRVATRVYEATDRRQQPWPEGTLIGETAFVFKEAAPSEPRLIRRTRPDGTVEELTTGAPSTPAVDGAEIAWSYLKDSTDAAALERFAAENKDHPRAVEALRRAASLTTSAPSGGSAATSPASGGGDPGASLFLKQQAAIYLELGRLKSQIYALEPRPGDDAETNAERTRKRDRLLVEYDELQRYSQLYYMLFGGEPLDSACEYAAFARDYPTSSAAALARTRAGGARPCDEGPSAREITTRIQTALIAMGCLEGAADGAAGPATRAGAARFRAAKGQSGTALDEAFMAAVEAASSEGFACPAIEPSPLPSARPAPQPSATASGRRAGEEFRDCSDCPVMVVVPAGSFAMGSPEGEEGHESDEGPQRSVTIPRAFAVGKFEVTWAEWEACVRGGGCGGYTPGDQGWGKGSRPVINVSWDDAQAYVGWLSSKTGEDYRLLSEAEWEYAARAGTTTPYSTGARITTAQANFNGDTYLGQTVPVGGKAANAFGLHDMHGNVWEWVEDCYANSYSAGQPSDGSAFTKGSCSDRVSRGGSWNNYPRILRSAYRNWLPPGVRLSILGFRLARTL